MKKVAYGIFLCVLISHSKVETLAEGVERSLNAMFSDGINEGNTNAEVQKLKGVPQVKCSNIIYNKGRKIVFCSAEIKTTYGEDMQSFGYTTCTSLGFILGSKGEIQERYNPEAFVKCNEKVYDASYD